MSYISLSNFHLDHSCFRLQLQWYEINFLWDDWNRDNFREMFKFEISVSNTIVWVRAYVNLINLQWDDCYSNISDEMYKFEVSIWSEMVWVASVISYKSSMRWLL